MAPDVWDDSAAYESYVGRWSRLSAASFIDWLDPPGGGAWLDVGCGTAALTREILARANPRLAVGCDRSAAYIAFASAQTADARARFVQAEVSDLPQTEEGFDAVVAGLVLNFLPSPLDDLVAMAARARRGGVVAAYVWDYAGQMQLMRYFWDAAVALNPSAEELDEGASRSATRSSWRCCSEMPDSLTSNRAASMCAPGSRTSTTTGRRFSEGKDPRRVTL